MAEKASDYRELLREVRRQPSISQEDLARELGVSFATINRWENGQSKPSRLAKFQLDAFCVRMVDQGRLRLSMDIASAPRPYQEDRSRRGNPQ